MAGTLLAAAAVGFCLLAAPLRPAASRAQRPLVLMADDAGGELISPKDLNSLRARIARIKESGGKIATPAEKLFELAIQKPPVLMLREFFATASPPIQQAMQDAIVSLLGALPPFEFDAQLTTTGDKLGALMMQLQTTGYMLRNAEYIVTVRNLLGLRSRNPTEYKKVFDKLDLDNSGFMDKSEVEALLREAYGGDEPPAFEVETMMRLFDTNNDGLISYEEFATALGADMKSAALDKIDYLTSLPAGDDPDAPPLPPVKVQGKVFVEMEDGEQVEMEASVYMEELKAEAQELRRELAKLTREEAERDVALSQSITSYVSSLPEAQIKLLTAGISEEVMGAMKLLVEYILKVPGADRPLGKDETITIDQDKLQQLCLYQLVLGYNLREKEAKGDARDIIGR